jgi:hypothetical protein
MNLTKWWRNRGRAVGLLISVVTLVSCGGTDSDPRIGYSVLESADYRTHGPFLPYGQACVDDPFVRYFLNGTKPPRRTECTGNPLLWDQLRPNTP